MGKDIFYIDYYVDEKRHGALGFLRMDAKKIEIVLKKVPLQGVVERNIYIINDCEEKRLLAKIALKDGTGQVQIEQEDIHEIMEKNIIHIPITTHSYGVCVMKSEQKTFESKKMIDEKNRQTVIELQPQIEPIIEADKWKQIYKSYPNVHVFLHRQTVLIKPKDMIILHRDYHGLATNSFLLHAYYNYRQLLLFRNIEEEKYYLGVPGVYNERERQLAILYGFAEFENGESQLENGNRREVYAGCFGYYMKRVEI